MYNIANMERFLALEWLHKMYIGIDLGGTNIAVGLVNDSGKIVCQKSTPTLAPRSCTEIVADMIKLSEDLVAEAGLTMADIQAVGIGCPGSVDYSSGSIIRADNLGFSNVPIREEFNKYYNVPVILENDANAAAYGEYIATGDNAEVFLAVTLGTGIGGGVILGGKLFTGSNGAGGEIGHFTLVHDGVLCSCGKKGCWESYASVTALINQTKYAMEKHPESMMHIIAEKSGKVNGKTAFDAAKQGDIVAQAVVNQYIKYVADGIVSMINIFQPNKIVIGGGISREGDYLLNPIKEIVSIYDYNRTAKKTEIQIATLFNDAGIIGSAFIAKNSL